MRTMKKGRREAELRMWQRTEQCHVRMTPAEHREIREAAGRAGLTMSSFVRLSALAARRADMGGRTLEDGSAALLLDRKTWSHIQRELNRWGVNLNQEARAANTIARVLSTGGPALPPDTVALLEQQAQVIGRQVPERRRQLDSIVAMLGGLGAAPTVRVDDGHAHPKVH